MMWWPRSILLRTCDVTLVVVCFWYLLRPLYTMMLLFLLYHVTARAPVVLACVRANVPTPERPIQCSACTVSTVGKNAHPLVKLRIIAGLMLCCCCVAGLLGCDVTGCSDRCWARPGLS